jgi:uncharacterized protein DUF4386
MKPDRKTAVIVGTLFIVATVASLVSTMLVSSTGVSNYLTSVSANANTVKLGVVAELVGALAVALIPAFLFPILRRYNEGVAVGYQAIRVVEAMVMVIGALSYLLLVTLSQQYVSAGSPATSSYVASGAVLQGLGAWAWDLDPFIFGIGALLFYGLLVRARLVPRWLSLWGLAGAALVFAAGLSALLSTFGALQYALAVPIAVQEMVLASWLILVGFNSTGTEIERGTGIHKSTPAANA